jgi:hypothetical protein
VKNSLTSFCFLIFSLIFFEGAPHQPSHLLKPHTTQNTGDTFNVIYENSTLYIKGLNVYGNLKIYSIIGNMIIDLNIQNFSKVVIPVTLEKQNLYIIRIETIDNRIYTHKIVAH